MFKKFLPQIIAMLFLVGFAVFAWTEPGSAPPGGNVPAPINVGSDAQTKAGDLNVNGFLKTLKDMVVGSVTIKSDGSVSPGLNVEKLGGYSASDVSNSGKVTGTITLGGSFFGGVCGGWGCNYCVCYENTTCSVQGRGFCESTTAQGYQNAPANYTLYAPVCDPGETLTLLSTQGANQSCGYQPLQCPTRTYQCTKPSINFPGCGNGIAEAGEVCEDGNQLNTVGNCAANCSKGNYFSMPQVNGLYMIGNGTSAARYCQEKGFSGYAKFNNYDLKASYIYCNPSWPSSYGNCQPYSFWNGSSWQRGQGGLILSLWELWCQ